MVELVEECDQKRTYEVDPTKVKSTKPTYIDLDANGDHVVSATQIQMYDGGSITVALPQQKVNALLNATVPKDQGGRAY